MPPLKRGAYWFATVCRSVDQVLSTQYLLTPSLDKYQTCCRGCPQLVDDPYWFSGHMFKGQGLTTLLSPLCCPLNIFESFTWSIPNLVQGLPSMSRWSLLMFKGQTTFWAQCVVHFIYFVPFLRTGFPSTEKINLNFAPWGAYMILKYFLVPLVIHCDCCSISFCCAFVILNIAELWMHNFEYKVWIIFLVNTENIT